MEASNSVVLLTTDPEAQQEVASVLGAAAGWRPAAVCGSLPELAAILGRSGARAALVDIDSQPGRMLSELSPIIARFGQVSFLVVSRESQGDLILQSLEAGARYYLVKSRISRDLLPALERFVSDHGGPRSREGRIITVLSAGGGCGATTLAINLANELGIATDSAALLVDMDFSYGAAGPCLDVRSQYGLGDVLLRKGPLDGELITTTAVKHSPSLDVLLSPASLGRFDSSPSYGNLPGALDACRSAYAWTVVDAPRVPAAVAATLAQASRRTLVVFQLNVKDLVVARAMLTALHHAGIPTGSLVPLAGRYHKRTQLVRLEDAERTLGVSIQCVANDFASATRCANFGKTLSEAAPRSLLRRSLQGLTGRLAAAAVEESNVQAGR